MDTEQNQIILTLKSMTNPYIEEIITQQGTDRKFVVRKFASDVSEEELIWHKDRKNRTIHILGGSKWKLQKEDELPIDLEVGKEYYIPRYTYHRVIKGEDDLVIRFPII